jgi:hypothetical protein
MREIEYLRRENARLCGALLAISHILLHHGEHRLPRGAGRQIARIVEMALSEEEDRAD